MRLPASVSFALHSPTGVRETYAYANNHFAGYAPETIRDLMQRVASE